MTNDRVTTGAAEDRYQLLRCSVAMVKMALTTALVVRRRAGRAIREALWSIRRIWRRPAHPNGAHAGIIEHADAFKPRLGALLVATADLST